MTIKQKLERIKKCLFIAMNYACSFRELQEADQLVQEIIDEI